MNMIDISKLTPEQLERFLHMQAIIDRQASDAAKVRTYRAYYDGDHPVFLTQRQQEYLGPLLAEAELPFNHNLCKVVVDKLRERLFVTGFTVNGESAAAPDNTEASSAARLAGVLWDWWTANAMNRQQVRQHRRALRDGKAYVMVDFDAGAQRPRFALHKVDDGQAGIVYHRDPSDENQVLFASRYFYTFDPLQPGKTGLERKTVYLPHEIRKYKRSNQALGGWEAVMDDGDLAWPLPWRDRRGQAVGVAAVEFQNPGGSEIKQMGGLQNGLNKSWLDLLAAADANGFPILAANYKDALVDIGEEDDGALDSNDLRVSPGRILEIFGGDLKRIEAASLDPMINTLWTVVAAIGGVTSTPQYYLKPILGVDVPSGEALKQLESGLVNKAEERQMEFGASWVEVMALAVRVHNAFAQRPIDVPEPLTIAAQWADPNTRIEKDEAEIAQIHKALGAPDDAVWARAGYKPDEIAAFRERARADRVADVAAIAGALQAQQGRTAPQTNPRTGGA